MCIIVATAAQPPPHFGGSGTVGGGTMANGVGAGSELVDGSGLGYGAVVEPSRRGGEGEHGDWGLGFRSHNCRGVQARDALPHTLRKLRGAIANVSYVPYAHVFIRNVFDSDYYRCILEALPHASEHKLFDKENKDRRAYRRITGDAGATMDPGAGARTQWRNHFWRDFSRSFAGNEIRDAWLRLFRRSLAPRFPTLPRVRVQLSPPQEDASEPELELSEEEEREMRQFEIRLDLSRDGDGYAITPHTDAVAKAVSMLYYLPRDESRADVGTRVYRSNMDDRGFGMTWKNWSGIRPPVEVGAKAGRGGGGGGGGGRREGGGDGGGVGGGDRGGKDGVTGDDEESDGVRHKQAVLFEEVEAAPFVPNAVFAFAPCRTSWHAVRPVVRPWAHDV